MGYLGKDRAIFLPHPRLHEAPGKRRSLALRRLKDDRDVCYDRVCGPTDAIADWYQTAGVEASRGGQFCSPLQRIGQEIRESFYLFGVFQPYNYNVQWCAGFIGLDLDVLPAQQLEGPLHGELFDGM